jgi:hypothetical protein
MSTGKVTDVAKPSSKSGEIQKKLNSNNYCHVSSEPSFKLLEFTDCISI